jgi:DNA-binding PadR family transcriptional regulator
MNKNTNMNIKEILTPLHFIILEALINNKELHGNELRKILLKNKIKCAGPNYYQLMSRMEKSKYVFGRYAQIILGDRVYTEKIYRITEYGKRALEATRNFYTKGGI